MNVPSGRGVVLREVFILFSSELKLPGPPDPDEGANDAPPRGLIVVLPPDSEREFLPALGAAPGQLPSAETSS